jgi:hypothetical protein
LAQSVFAGQSTDNIIEFMGPKNNLWYGSSLLRYLVRLENLGLLHMET